MATYQNRTIGVLTSGGDAPGMNAVVRAVVRSALHKGFRVVGIRRGYNGLLTGDMFEMNIRSVSEIIHRGGTILYTDRCLEFQTAEGFARALKTCRDKGIGNIVTIGGDGTFRGARELCENGISCIGIPGTIDNDIACSEYTIGFDTALNTATEMIDKLRDTTMSHNRCSVVEVMGHKSGYLAVNTGIACGALTIIVPEIPYDFERDIIERMNNTQSTGKRHFIIVMAEGCGSAYELAKRIEERTNITTRATILGHVQRGGSPTNRDRVMASQMGFHAVKLLEAGASNRVVAYKNGLICDFDISEALEMKKTVDADLLRMSETISI
ncbi:MAG: 6-phosphofructokinase [Oscillospiraceae bacterium]|nr:6-phosphofructokinase [Oscillospiraceae bacterium]